MTCKHCGEDICDTCWQKRADILYERDDLRAEAQRLRGHLETVGMYLEKMQRGEPAGEHLLTVLGDIVEAERKGIS